MITNFTYRIPLNGREFAKVHEAMTEHAERVIDARPYLLAYDIRDLGQRVEVLLRITDIDRWRSTDHAKSTIIGMVLKARLTHTSIELYQRLEEPNRRTFLDGEGRTPRPRRPRLTPAP